jgi:hypothetical protein
MNLKMSAPSPSPPPPSPPPTNNNDNPPPTNNQNNNENNNNNAPVQYEFMELPPTPGDNTTAHTVTQFISPVKTADQSPHSDPPSSHQDIASLLDAASNLEAEAATAPIADTATATSVPTGGSTSNEIAAPKLPSISATQVKSPPSASTAASAAATEPAQSIESPAAAASPVAESATMAAPSLGQLKDPGNSITSLLSQDNDPSQCDDQDLIIPDPSHALATPFLTASLDSWIRILKAEGVEADTDEIVDIMCIYCMTCSCFGLWDKDNQLRIPKSPNRNFPDQMPFVKQLLRHRFHSKTVSYRLIKKGKHSRVKMAAGSGGGDGDDGNGSGGDDWDDDDDEFDLAPDVDTDMEDDVGESTKSKQAHDSVKKQLASFQQYNAVLKHLQMTIHVLKPLMSVIKSFHVNTRSEAMTIAQYIRDKSEGRQVASEVCNMHDSSSCQQQN